MSAPPALECPFCTSELPEAAIRCPACGQDVALIMPALRRLKAHQASISALREEWETLRQLPAPGSIAGPVAPETDGGMARVFAAAGLSYVLLLAIHYLAVIQFDLPNIVLRVASIGVPCAVVLLLPGVNRASLGAFAGTGLILGLGAAISMSAVVAAVDGVRVLPHDPRGQREFAEYAGSIALAHIAGGAILRARRNLSVTRTMRANMTDKAANAQRLAEAALPLTALLASVYGGLRALWG